MLRAAAVAVLVPLMVVVTAVVVGRGRPIDRATRTVPQPRPNRVEPSRVPKPLPMASPAGAPQDRPAESAGALRLPRLGIAMPVVRVGWDGTAVAVPDDPAIAGWFGSTAALPDRAGVSLIAAHVADRRDRAGPLARLVGARIGDVVVWSARGIPARFRVVSIGRYPRAAGLPAALFRVDGPHMLLVVTCTDRRSGVLGFHYADNLVVSAQQIVP